MIQKAYHCRVCGSTNIVKNGTNRLKQQQYHCKDCGARRVLESKREAKKRKNRSSSMPTKSASVKDTLLPAKPEDILEYDEAWSFVFQKINKRWLWTVLCRRTRQIIAFVIGDRSENSCRRLWKKVPIEYRRCLSYSDFWDAYQKVLPQEAHHAIGKESGQTSHMERWYCTLRQHQARYVRKTLSFSKRDAFHHMVTKWFIVDHNLVRKQFPALTL